MTLSTSILAPIHSVYTHTLYIYTHTQYIHTHTVTHSTARTHTHTLNNDVVNVYSGANYSVPTHTQSLALSLNHTYTYTLIHTH